MDILELPEPLEFEWDQHNTTKIRLKHGIVPEEAEQVFLSYKLMLFDEKHSSGENRYQILGTTNAGKILFIAFTMRINKIRIISARDANKKERTKYAQA